MTLDAPGRLRRPWGWRAEPLQGGHGISAELWRSFVSSVMLVNPLRVEKQWQGRLSKRSNVGWGGERQGRTSGLESGSRIMLNAKADVRMDRVWEFLTLRCFYNRDVQTDRRTDTEEKLWGLRMSKNERCGEVNHSVPARKPAGSPFRAREKCKGLFPWGHVSQQLQGIKPVTRRSKFTLSVHILYLAYYQDSFSS